MAKKISGYVNIVIPAGKANPAPPIGTALGPRGVNIMEFCKAFNAKTSSFEPGVPTPVVITIFVDKSFEFIIKKPPVSYMLLQAAGVKKGSGETGKSTAIGKVTRAQIKKIAQDKIEDMNANNIEAACKMIEGSAMSMGIEVIEG